MANEGATGNGLLVGRVALVTGASGGLGTSVCQVFAREGAAVQPVDLTGDSFIADIATAEGNQLAIDETIRRFGKLDTLVLNAGVQFMSRVEEFPEQEWDRLVDTMLKGPFLTAKLAWPHLIANPRGRIVITASVGAYVGDLYKSAYIAAKTGVVGLVRALAMEGAEHNLTVNAVAPSWMRTPMVEGQLEDHVRMKGLSRDEVIADMVGRQPIKRFIETDEVADVMAFLASDRASAITGVCLPIDLGFLVS
jgi:3-hydroxybutyrate dehydrogenase